MFRTYFITLYFSLSSSFFTHPLPSAKKAGQALSRGELIVVNFNF